MYTRRYASPVRNPSKNGGGGEDLVQEINYAMEKYTGIRVCASSQYEVFITSEFDSLERLSLKVLRRLTIEM